MAAAVAKDHFGHPRGFDVGYVFPDRCVRILLFALPSLIASCCPIDVPAAMRESTGTAKPGLWAPPRRVPFLSSYPTSMKTTKT